MLEDRLLLMTASNRRITSQHATFCRRQPTSLRPGCHHSLCTCQAEIRTSHQRRRVARQSRPPSLNRLHSQNDSSLDQATRSEKRNFLPSGFHFHLGISNPDRPIHRASREPPPLATFHFPCDAFWGWHFSDAH